MKESNILGVYSIQFIVDDFFKPIVIEVENYVLSPKYMHIRQLIPAVLDLHNVQYSHWASLFHDAARANNLLHHIDPQASRPDMNQSDDDTIIWCQQDAILLTWIFATITPYLIMRVVPPYEYTTSAMDCWARLREICQQHDTAMQRKKRRFMDIDLNDESIEQDDCVDLISGLPDHVLIYMLSLATDLKTAGRTSILSKRWTNLWTHLMDLDFNDHEAAAATFTWQCFAQPEMDKFADWVNRVISANQALYIDTFKIDFPLITSYAAHIDNWVKFAFNKQVRNLELNVIDSKILFNPALILNTTLQSLHLKSVSIKGPLLQWTVTNCPNLQRLSFHLCTASPGQHLKLVISSPKLKHLEFFYCLKLLKIHTLVLSAPNLTSFVFYDSKIDVEYHSVPSLVDVTLGGLYLHHLDTLSGFSSQLQKLSLLWEEAYLPSVQKSGCRDFLDFRRVNVTTFINVQLLEIVYSERDLYLLSMTSLMEACPLMHTFTLKIMCWEQQEGLRQLSAPTNAPLHAIRCLEHLKAVEYVGYAGCAFAAKLALYLPHQAPMLRRFIFDTRRPQFIGKPRGFYTSDHEDRMKIVKTTELLAEQIRSRSHADVVIL